MKLLKIKLLENGNDQVLAIRIRNNQTINTYFMILKPKKIPIPKIT